MVGDVNDFPSCDWTDVKNVWCSTYYKYIIFNNDQEVLEFLKNCIVNGFIVV